MDRPYSKGQIAPERPAPKRPSNRAELVDIDFEKYVGYRHKKNPSLRAKALRTLAGFLALMVVFTLLSRAADEMTIARVKTAEPEKRSIEHKVTATGKAEENGAKSVTAYPGVRVSDLSVKAGGRVEKDAPLFTLDRTDLEEKLEEAKLELKKLDLDISDQQSRDALSDQDRSTALSRAQQDSADAKRSADKEVERARKALADAQQRLDDFRANPPKNDLAALEAACAQKQEALNQAQADLSSLLDEVEQKVSEARVSAGDAGADPDAAEQEIRSAYESRVDSANSRVELAKQEKKVADDALATASGGGDASTQEQALADAVSSAQQGYDQAVSARDTALKAAGRAIEDAQKGTPSDSTGEKNQLARDAQAKKVEEIQSILDDGCQVRAPLSGVVTKLDISVGAPTPDGTALLLTDGTGGSAFTAQVPSDQEKYLAPGVEVTLKLDNDLPPVTGLKIETVAKNPENPDLLDVTVRLPDGTLDIGASATMEAVQKSKDYGSCVPLSALHEENGIYYLLVPQENAGILGSELSAERLNVEVEEKNDTYAALNDWSLAPGQKFITESNKTVEAGDRVRPEQA